MRLETLERIVDAALGTEVRSARRPDPGSVADTYLLEVASDSDGLANRVVCKLGGASIWTGGVIEPFVVERIREATDLPVPTVLASGTLEGGDVERWALYEYCPGETPVYDTLEPAVRRRLVADAGEFLGRLQASSTLAFDRVGGLTREGARLVVREPDGWHALEPESTLERAIRSVAGDPTPVATHGDYQPSNLLIDDDGSVTAVLDWGNAHVTHARYALARAEIRFVDLHRGLSADERARLRRTFRRRYARYGPLEADVGDWLWLYKCCWMAQSGANYGHVLRDARGRGQLWRQCRRLL